MYSRTCFISGSFFCLNEIKRNLLFSLSLSPPILLHYYFIAIFGTRGKHNERKMYKKKKLVRKNLDNDGRNNNNKKKSPALVLSGIETGSEVETAAGPRPTAGGRVGRTCLEDSARSKKKKGEKKGGKKLYPVRNKRPPPPPLCVSAVTRKHRRSNVKLKSSFGGRRTYSYLLRPINPCPEYQIRDAGDIGGGGEGV